MSLYPEPGLAGEKNLPRALCFPVLGRHLVGAVGETAELIVTEEDRVGGGEAEKDPHREVPDLAFGVPVGPHLDYVPQGPDVPREDHRRLGLVGQHRARCLLHLLARVGLVLRTEQRNPLLLALQQAVRHRLVLSGGPVGPLLKEVMKLWIVLVLGALYKTQYTPRNVTLRNLAHAHSGPVANQLVGDATADTIEQEAEVGVLQYAAVSGGGEALEVRRSVLVGGAAGAAGSVAEPFLPLA